MGYFKDVLTTSLRPIKVVVLQSMQGQKALNFTKNILICVLKMNKGLTSLEYHVGAINDNFHLGVSYPFKSMNAFTEQL